MPDASLGHHPQVGLEQLHDLSPAHCPRAQSILPTHLPVVEGAASCRLCPPWGPGKPPITLLLSIPFSAHPQTWWNLLPLGTVPGEPPSLATIFRKPSVLPPHHS